MFRFALVFFLFLLPVLIAGDVYAEKLPRRVFMGIRMETLTEDAREMMEIPRNQGVLISEVIPGSTAEEAGFRKGDILLKLDGSSLSDPSEVVAFLSEKQGGTQFTYELLRNRKPVKGKAVFLELPVERYTGIDMIYTEASSVNGEQRMIISKKEGVTARMPVILFIGGIACYSLDFPFDSTRSEVRLLNAITRAGYMCVRAEKPGVGDNLHSKIPCDEVSFMEENDGYVAMIRALKARPDVDSNEVYILGHSMGGVFAPIIASKTRITGIIAYGAIGSNMLEYLVKTRKTIAASLELSPSASDNLVKLFTECAVYYFSDGMTSDEAEQKKPGCKNFISIFDHRSRRYNDELYVLNIPALWSSYDGNALLLWGASDFLSSEDDHRMAADALNRSHPGRATFITIPKADHPMLTAADFVASQRNPGGYNEAVGSTIIKWLKGQ